MSGLILVLFCGWFIVERAYPKISMNKPWIFTLITHSFCTKILNFPHYISGLTWRNFDINHVLHKICPSTRRKEIKKAIIERGCVCTCMARYSLFSNFVSFAIQYNQKSVIQVLSLILLPILENSYRVPILRTSCLTHTLRFADEVL